MATVGELMTSRGELRAVSDTPALDISVLLGHCLGRTKEFLYAHPEYELSADEAECFRERFERRRRGEPVAYLTGRREFWSLPLTVTVDTLIPRPDTECLVETALRLRGGDSALQVLDLGTGSGAIALALAAERPDWNVIGVDRESAAVAVAQANAKALALSNARFLRSDWYGALGARRFDLIVANPPYIASDDPHLERGDLRFEPRSALVAEDGGLADIRHIVTGAPAHLCDHAALLLEHGYKQGEAVRALLERSGFVAVATGRDYGGHERVTHGRLA